MIKASGFGRMEKITKGRKCGKAIQVNGATSRKETKSGKMKLCWRFR